MLPDSAYLLVLNGEKRFQYRGEDGKADKTLLRACVEQIAASELSQDVAAPLMSRAQDLLLRANRAPEKPIRAEQRSGTTEISASGRIGEGFFEEGITRASIKRVVDQNPSAPVLLHLNSGGGDAFEGESIRAYLASLPDVTVQVGGIAGSAASIVAMGASPGKLQMSPGSVMFVHRAGTGAFGNEDVLEKALMMARAVDAGALQTYVARTKLPVERVREMMRAETTLSAVQAVELGFADAVLAHAPTQCIDAQLADLELDGASAEAIQRCAKLGIIQSDEIVVDVEETEDMKPEEIAAIVQQALAPVVQRLDKIETAGAPATEQAASTARKFQLNRHTAFQRLVSAGKIAPDDRDFFYSQAVDQASLGEAVSHYDAAEQVVSTSAHKMPKPPEQRELGADKPTASQLKVCQIGGWKPELLYPGTTNA